MRGPPGAVSNHRTAIRYLAVLRVFNWLARSHHAKDAEIHILRHQVALLQRVGAERLGITSELDLRCRVCVAACWR